MQVNTTKNVKNRNTFTMLCILVLTLFSSLMALSAFPAFKSGATALSEGMRGVSAGTASKWELNYPVS